jgi:hydroxymethylpyrimidine/phosphomethylpyrimidine kinase
MLLAVTTLTPCAMAISGLDPSGGAGLFADLRAFRAASVWGCGAVAVVTVQSTEGLRSSHPVPARQLLGQILELCSHQNIRSIKIGALGSVENVRTVTRFLTTKGRKVPIVLDPVMVSTRGPRGARLLEVGATRALAEMAKRVTVITPNVPEAEVLLDVRIRSIEDAERAARAFLNAGARAALIKGGHLPRRSSQAAIVDVLAIGNDVFRLPSRRVHAELHGTGCTLASLIAGKLAATRTLTNETILDAVRWAKQKLEKAVAHRTRIGGGLLVLPL